MAQECVAACRVALPAARFQRVNALGERPQLRALLAAEAPSLIVVDIGGVRAVRHVSRCP